ncbi:hypothetical protein KC19_VG050600 [Ceratodon purpureus]|uniref:Uncharacterized protein n=1 Tax=Ceratodon purpureus TaxID=3225 RepID=A0A8T0HM37_CERPU|nr:hypothetical protein KC19_VG050600 [Ceratodon purpureus]
MEGLEVSCRRGGWNLSSALSSLSRLTAMVYEGAPGLESLCWLDFLPRDADNEAMTGPRSCPCSYLQHAMT